MRITNFMVALACGALCGCTGGKLLDDYGYEITGRVFHVVFSSTQGQGNHGVTVDPGDATWAFDPYRTSDDVYRRREIVPPGEYVVYAGEGNPCRVDEFFASRLPIDHDFHGDCDGSAEDKPCQIYDMYLHRYHAQPGLPLQGGIAYADLHMTYYSANAGLGLPGCGTTVVGGGTDSGGTYVLRQCNCSWFHSSEIGKWKWKVY